jgi:hypothetical protein
VEDPIKRAPTELVGSKSEPHMTGKIQHVVSLGLRRFARILAAAFLRL